ncbi:hypothetical protein [Methylobacterium sp. ID0610]|uniref:hypothetical protein n=1 Tax=Methylobacterium carpenticola TaxID=3344827 RepID=UPI0036BEF90D
MERHSRSGSGRPPGLLPDRVAQVSGRPAEASGVRYERAPSAPTERVGSYIPWPLRLALKLGLALAVMAGGLFGPSFLDCRKRREEGGFYYGVTMGACTRQGTFDQIAMMQRRLEDVARAIGAR